MNLSKGGVLDRTWGQIPADLAELITILADEYNKRTWDSFDDPRCAAYGVKELYAEAAQGSQFPEFSRMVREYLNGREWSAKT